MVVPWFFKIFLELMAGVWIDGFFLLIVTFISFFNGYLLVGSGVVFCLLSAI
jgi:hypothetical protein